MQHPKPTKVEERGNFLLSIVRNQMQRTKHSEKLWQFGGEEMHSILTQDNKRCLTPKCRESCHNTFAKFLLRRHDHKKNVMQDDTGFVIILIITSFQLL